MDKDMSGIAFIFDFDGLILNTEIALFNAYQKLFNGYGFEFGFADWGKTIGAGPSAYDPSADLANRILQPEKAELFKQITKSQANESLITMPALPGVTNFIQKAFELGVPMAIASSSSRQWVVNHLTNLEILRYFNYVLTADDVELVKPYPDLYLTALEKLSIPAWKAIAFEDSVNGIKAAKAAGLYCIAVPNEITREMPVQIADQVVSSFHELDPVEILVRVNTTKSSYNMTGD